MAGKKQSGAGGEEMNWISRKLLLYNVTFGLYVMDWWERCLFNTTVMILIWSICYNISRLMWKRFDNNLIRMLVQTKYEEAMEKGSDG